jgi:hypothetical protein
MAYGGMRYAIPRGYFLTGHKTAASKPQMPIIARQTAMKILVLFFILTAP